MELTSFPNTPILVTLFMVGMLASCVAISAMVSMIRECVVKKRMKQ